MAQILLSGSGLERGPLDSLVSLVSGVWWLVAVGCWLASFNLLATNCNCLKCVCVCELCACPCVVVVVVVLLAALALALTLTELKGACGGARAGRFHFTNINKMNAE